MTRGIFLSPEFGTLARAEKQQEWCGAYVDSRAEPKVLELLYNRTPPLDRDLPLLKYPVPTKKNAAERLERWCFNWASFLDPPILARNIPKLTSPKREHTADFAHYSAGLPDTSQLAGESLRPAIRVRTMKARSGFRIRCIDAAGVGVIPEIGTVTWQVRRQ